MTIFIPGNEHIDSGFNPSGIIKQGIYSEVEELKENFNSILHADKLPELEVLTIDDFDSKHLKNPYIKKDLDDSLNIKKTSYGWKLKAPIALPSALFSEDSFIEQWAKIMTESVYFESHVKTMLPMKIANYLASLVYGKKRLALVCELEISNNGEVLDTKLYKARVKNIAMMNHEEFNKNLLDSGESFYDQIYNLTKLSSVLETKRREKGFVDFNDANRTTGYTKKTNDIGVASKVIEEIMILVNRTIANFIYENKIQGIYRNHMPEYMGKKFNGDIMPRAFYSPEAEGHFALNLIRYLHFTSPIRRYPDLFNHRRIIEFLEKDKIIIPDNKIIISAGEIGELTNYITKKQEQTHKTVDIHNQEYSNKMSRKELQKIIGTQLKNKTLSKESIGELNDSYIEMYLYNFIKNKKEIPEYFLENLEKRFKSKDYNKEILFILAFSKNKKLIELFNKYFVTNTLKAQFINYFNNYKLIKEQYSINFKKSKCKYTDNEDFIDDIGPISKVHSPSKKKKTRDTNCFIKRVKTKVFNRYYLDNKINRIKLFVNTGEETKTKNEAFKELLDFILTTNINFLL